jgi:Ras-related GTP-binding protein A/B
MSSPAIDRKVLLMGRENAGKTSMRSIIFANYIARETNRIGATIGVEHSNMRFVGNLTLNLHDCGGQEGFMKDYLSEQRDSIFSNVSVMIYIFDVASDNAESDLKWYQKCVEALQQTSPNAMIFCLIHKMDLIAEEEREKFFARKRRDLEEASAPMSINCLPTSIWDETLYKAWSEIVYRLIPNIGHIESLLQKFCQIAGADEVVLFERETFLFICHTSLREYKDIHRFENISNIVKNFKLSCRKTSAHFVNMEVRNSLTSVFIDAFTQNTYILVVLSDPSIQATVTLANIKKAMPRFEKYLSSDQ